jgi:hypothetical protein
MKLYELDQLIKAVAPISGICIDPRRIDYLPEAAQAQIDAAEAIMDANIALVTNEPAPAPEPTKAELQAQLAALAAKIEAL